MKKMKKLVVCGGAGFLGQNLIPLLKKKYEVVVIDKHKENLDTLLELNPEVQVVFSDLSKKTNWTVFFQGADVVIQLNAQIAAMTKKPFVDNNVTATKNILDTIKKYKVPYIVHISSASVISIRQDDYAITKKEGEEIITKNKTVKYSVLRPSMLYGLFDNKNVGWLVQFMKKMPVFPIPGSGKYPRQPVFAPDFAKIILKLVEKRPKNKIYNINTDPINFIDMVKLIRKSRKLKRLLIKIPIPIFILLMRIYNFILRKVEFTAGQVKSLTTGETFEMMDWEKEFGVKKTSFKEGLFKMSKSSKKDFMLKR